MERLIKLKDSVMEYLSPTKRRNTLPIATPPTNPDLRRRPVQHATEPRNMKRGAIIAGRVSKNYRSPTNAKRSAKIPRSRANSDEEPEDEQAYAKQISEQIITPEDSSSQVKVPGSEDSVTGFEEEEEEHGPDDLEISEYDSELDTEAKVYQYLNNQRDIARHREALEMIRDEEWHKDEAALFMRLKMRGFEPLIPSYWSYDFRTCPQTVFSSNVEETLINAMSGNEFRGAKALLSLITLGGRVRALLECHKPQEQVIKKEIENYIKWSERDGGYDSKHFLPLLCLIAGRPNQDLPTISKATTDQMEFLAERHRQALALPPPGQLDENGEVQIFSEQPPVVYGIIVAQCVTVFLTLDSGNPDAKPKTIAHFDFSDKNIDVWNGFAVAILVCMVRNRLMASKEEMESITEETDSDPDL